MSTATAPPSTAGALLRDWRQRRRMSQLDLGLQAGVSARHVSFVETGRSRPSAEMVITLSDHLDVPLRERNVLLLAAGHAPVYAQHDLDEPEMAPVRAALERVLGAHQPFPALVCDRQWGLVLGNDAVGLLVEGVAPELLEPPANVLRAALHPDGMAPRILNLAEWRTHLLHRLAREHTISGDPALLTLHDELAAYPGGLVDEPLDLANEIAVPLKLRGPGGAELTFVSTVTTFGTATDVTLSELTIEAFLPADDATMRALQEAA
jgi:transcriptional regulator with XRE-family HTH domain